MKRALITFVAALSIGVLSAQEDNDGFFASSNFSKPFLSEMHSVINKVELGFNKFNSEFDLLGEKSKFDRPMVELHVGYELPLYASGYSISKTERKWGFGARLPLSVHCLEDMWGPETAPVINTDYRFGGPKIMAIRKISDDKFIKNISLSWLTIFHECTHLGDELVIYRMDEKIPITRINVSYEFTELQLTLNDPVTRDENYQSFKLGIQYRISNRGLGWYSVRKDIEASDSVVIPASNYRTEFYAEYQLQRTTGFLASKRCVNVISFEVRDRLRYGYPIYNKVGTVWQAKEVKERMEFCFNLYVGYRFYPKIDRSNAVGLFFHAYRGVNPYGQLRNYPSYPFFGVSLTYEIF
jgi:hypothetical protein